VKRDAEEERVEEVEEMEEMEEPDRMKPEMCNFKNEDECDGGWENKRKMLAHAYVLWQCYDDAFNPQEALKKGTLFPNLYGVYPVPN